MTFLNNMLLTSMPLPTARSRLFSACFLTQLSPRTSTHFSINASPQRPQAQDQSTTNLQSNQVVPDFRPANLLLPSNNGVVSAIKPVPPPASLPRKFDSSSHNQRVVNPPKETCFKCVARSLCSPSCHPEPFIPQPSHYVSKYP